MTEILMADILPLIGLPMPPTNRSSYNVPCPCCDSRPRDKHLNINLAKNVFRCPRCGFSGGIFDLFAHYAGVDRSEAREVLLARLSVPENIPLRQSPKPKTVEEIETPLTDIEARHQTYTALLNSLSLASDHVSNLKNRGLPEEEISRLGYKTTPVMGTAAIAKKLAGEGCYLTGVPGFYRTEAGTWDFVHEARGILIPVRDQNGLIQGLQIRRDNVTKRKFRWISSVGKPDGCKSLAWAHLAGTPRPRVILTEGPMKADVIHHLSGQTVLAVPGVNSLAQVEGMLQWLHENGTEQIMTAFDMDFLTNPHVRNGYQNLVNLLAQTGIRYGTYLWNPEYKGLDDYIWEFCYKQQ